MLDEKSKKSALKHLNDICPDTFDEGELGPWKFKDLTRVKTKWKLSFKNAQGAGFVTFTFARDCVDPKGAVSSAWFEKVNTAIGSLEGDEDI